MDRFKAPTEVELRKEYADMLHMYADFGQKALEAYILQKGRLEMQHMLAYLFVRSASAEMKNIQLVDQLKECESRYDFMGTIPKEETNDDQSQHAG